jgi:hypothetical protein
MAGRELFLSGLFDSFCFRIEIQSDLAVPDEEPRNRQNQSYHAFCCSGKITAQTRV